jgi:hypothetical protein
MLDSEKIMRRHKGEFLEITGQPEQGTTIRPDASGIRQECEVARLGLGDRPPYPAGKHPLV